MEIRGERDAGPQLKKLLCGPDGGQGLIKTQCRLLNQINGNVPCRYLKYFPVDSKIVQCPLSILGNGNVPCH